MIEIDNFQGLLTSPSKSDVPINTAQVANNVDFETHGKLKNRHGYDLPFELPSNFSLFRAFQHKWVLREPYGTKKVWIVIGSATTQETTGEKPHEVWWRPYWNPATQAWVDDWQELTEFEGIYTASNIAGGASGDTDADSIYDLSSLNFDSDDYYNKFVVLNLTRQTVTRVTDYVGSERKLVLAGSVSGQQSGDKYIMYRFCLTNPIEGVNTAGTGTNETSLVDTALLCSVDDYYVGWRLKNTTVGGDDVAITGYNGKTKKLTHEPIVGQVPTDNYYIYNQNYDIKATDVRLFQRGNALEFALGNDYPYPIKAPLWFGFIDDVYYFDDEFSDTGKDGFYFCRNVMSAPNVTVGVTNLTGSGSLTNGDYYFKYAFVYDGYQVGALSNFIKETEAASTAIGHDLNIVPNLSDASYKSHDFEALLNKRITHIEVYIAVGESGHVRDDYYRFARYPIRSDIVTKPEKLNDVWLSFGGGYFSLQLANVPNDITDSLLSGTDRPYDATSGVNLSKGLKWTEYAGHKSELISPNYKFKALLEEQSYVGPVYLDKREDLLLLYSVASKANSTPSDDVYPQENLINMMNKQVSRVTGIMNWGSDLLILTTNKVFRYISGRHIGGVFDVGSVSANGSCVINAENGRSIAWLDYDDVYLFDGQPVGMMKNRIADQWRSISASAKESGIIGYHKNRSQLHVYAGTWFIYNFNKSEWSTYSTNITPLQFFQGVDGDFYAITTGGIYEIFSSTPDEVVKMDWKSNNGVFSKGTKRIVRAMVSKLLMKYKTNRTLTVNLFDESYSLNYPKAKIKISGQSLDKARSFGVNQEFHQISIQIKDEDTGLTLPQNEIDYLAIDWDELK